MAMANVPPTTLATWLFLLFLPTLISGNADSYLDIKLDSDTCSDIGLNKDTLMCSHCDILQKFELSKLRESCKQCCNPALTSNISEIESPSTKFYKARLEVCWCKFPSMPQIEAFVKTEEKEHRFKNLELKHMQYQNPIIKLFNVEGYLVETLSISKWTTDTIAEYLALHLQEENENNEI